MVDAVAANNDPAFGWTAARLEEAVESLGARHGVAARRLDKDPDAALAGATPYLRLFGPAPAAACWRSRRCRRCASATEAAPRIALARFFAENSAVQASALERSIVEGGPGILGADAALAQV